MDRRKRGREGEVWEGKVIRWGMKQVGRKAVSEVIPAPLRYVLTVVAFTNTSLITFLLVYIGREICCALQKFNQKEMIEK